MLVFGDGELRPHSCRERVQRVKGGLASIMKFYIFQPGRSRTCEHRASGGTGFGKPSRHNSSLGANLIIGQRGQQLK